MKTSSFISSFTASTIVALIMLQVDTTVQQMRMTTRDLNTKINRGGDLGKLWTTDTFDISPTHIFQLWKLR